MYPLVGVQSGPKPQYCTLSISLGDTLHGFHLMYPDHIFHNLNHQLLWTYQEVRFRIFLLSDDSYHSPLVRYASTGAVPDCGFWWFHQAADVIMFVFTFNFHKMQPPKSSQNLCVMGGSSTMSMNKNCSCCPLYQ